jgi:tetratricopeptide (TPR) repeat protein
MSILIPSSSFTQTRFHSSSPQKPLDIKYQQALRTLKSAITINNYTGIQGGVTLLNQIISEDKTYAPAYNALGVIYTKRFRLLNQAKDYFQKALMYDMNNPKYSINLGNLYGELGGSDENFDLALKCYDNALESEPQNAWLHYNRGILFEKMGQPALAERPFRLAVQLEPKVSKEMMTKDFHYLLFNE